MNQENLEKSTPHGSMRHRYRAADTKALLGLGIELRKSRPKSANIQADLTSHLQKGERQLTSDLLRATLTVRGQRTDATEANSKGDPRASHPVRALLRCEGKRLTFSLLESAGMTTHVSLF